MKLIEVFLAGAFSCALFMILHAANWKRIFGKRPQAPWTYVAGVVGLGVPFALLMARWSDWWALAGAAAVVVGGGASVIYGYYVRGIACKDGPSQNLAADEYEAIISVLRKQNAALEGKLMRAERERNAKREGKAT